MHFIPTSDVSRDFLGMLSSLGMREKEGVGAQGNSK